MERDGCRYLPVEKQLPEESRRAADSDVGNTERKTPPAQVAC